MEVELHPMPASIRAPYAARVTSSKADLQKVKKTLVRPFPPFFPIVLCLSDVFRGIQKDLQRESQRSELLGGGRRRGDPSLQDEPYTDGDDRDVRERLLAGTETLSDGMSFLSFLSWSL